MSHRHAWRGILPPWVGGLVLLAIVLCASAIPGHTWRGGGHRGGGHGFHGGHRLHGGHRFHGGHGFRHGKYGWGGVGVSIGVGPYWGPYWGSYWGPYGYPYTYPYYSYPYTYAPQISVQPAQPLTMQQSSSPVWYYCDNPEGYYPYVQQCPDGWRTVAPSPQ